MVNNEKFRLAYSLVIFCTGYWSFQLEDSLYRALGFVILIPMGVMIGLYILSYGLSLVETKSQSLNAGFELAIFFTSYIIFSNIFMSVFGVLFLAWKSEFELFRTLGLLVTLAVSLLVHRLAFDKSKSPFYTSKYFGLGYIAVIILLIVYALPDGYAIIRIM